MIFTNRETAGEQLAIALNQYKGCEGVVLALPRGGVILGAKLAEALKLPLGVVLVRKLSHPADPEYAIGAVAEDDSPIYNQSEIESIDQTWLDQQESEARKLIEKRRAIYYGTSLFRPDITDKIVIIVDDGIATGWTMKAAIHAVQHKNPKKLVVAVPIASQESIDSIKKAVDQIELIDNSDNFLGSIGAHYQEFNQVNDEEVRMLLREVNYDYSKRSIAKAR